jgi:ABC-type multidrug transport system ATPase subunit
MAKKQVALIAKEQGLKGNMAVREFLKFHCDERTVSIRMML